MNKEELFAFISSTSWKGSKLGLERISELLRLLGNPQDELKYIHVAGTNGKGSACMMLAEILKQCGYRTGLYTSPHLSIYNERFIVNGEMISDEGMCALGESVKRAADLMEDKPTEFEIVTAMAFLYFKEQSCDFVVLEVGMGGRYDATNVIKESVVSLIMNIGLDHVAVLGDTVEKIAYEKAGIIKSNGTVVCYPNSESVMSVFRQEALKQGAAITFADFNEIQNVKKNGLVSSSFAYKEHEKVEISLLGEHQLKNAAVVLETVSLLRAKGFDLSEEKVLMALAHTFWPARLEVLCKEPLFILDGAHNLQCALALRDSLKDILTDEACFLMGMLKDKDYMAVIEAMEPFARSFVCVTPDSDRALPASELAAILNARGFKALVAEDIEDGLHKVIKEAGETAVVAFGSLYMAGAIRDLAYRIL